MVKYKILCSHCSKEFQIDLVQHFCPDCMKPLILDYGFKNTPKSVISSTNSMWRYNFALPVQHEKNCVSLGEGWTPIIKLNNLEKKYEYSQLYLKDEGLNPTGSFKSRGLSAAISMAKEHGISECIIPTAGNAGGALSAYCARAGIKATVVMPAHTPKAFQQECKVLGAEVILVEGLINDCGKRVGEIKQVTGAFDVSTLKEPFRIEGKKTMGYEIAEQFDWQLPDVILYPTGGGTGLIGIWKAFQEMKALGWISGKLPTMIAVQSEVCSPMVDQFISGKKKTSYSASIANGLAVPVAFGENLIMKTLQESKGTAISVTEKQLKDRTLEIGKSEGIFVAPEGGAIWQACLDLTDSGFISKDDKIVLLNTGSGYKYADNIV